MSPKAFKNQLTFWIVDGTVYSRAARSLHVIGFPPTLVWQWGHRSQGWKGQAQEGRCRRHLGFACLGPWGLEKLVFGGEWLLRESTWPPPSTPLLSGLCSDKEPACQCRRCKRHRFDPLIGKISWRRERLPTLVFLPGEFHGQKSLVGYSPWGCKEWDTSEHTHFISKVKLAILTILWGWFTLLCNHSHCPSPELYHLPKLNSIPLNTNSPSLPPPVFGKHSPITVSVNLTPLGASRAKANRVLLREHTGHSKHPLPTTQETTLHMDIPSWSIPKSDWLYSLQLREGEALYS